MNSKLLKYFREPWQKVSSVWLDTETTGTRPGIDRAVSVAVVRFENGVVVGERSALVNAGMPIPAEATAIHGITDEMVRGAMTIEEFFRETETLRLLDDAQPGAYRASFDQRFVPPFLDDADWPWLDALPIVRHIDRWTPGSGRHRLSAACTRHGVTLNDAHSALADARAAGQLFYKLVPQVVKPETTLGELLMRQQLSEWREWWRFNDWLSQQPERPNAAANS